MGKVIAAIIGILIVAGFTYFKVQGYTFNPDKAQFIYSDLNRFNKAMSSLEKSTDTIKVLEKYISKKSKGFAKYIKMYGFSTKQTYEEINHNKTIVVYQSCYRCFTKNERD